MEVCNSFNFCWLPLAATPGGLGDESLEKLWWNVDEVVAI